jgi:hypothetical protein
MGGMSAKSNFQFGRNLGLIEALVCIWNWEKLLYVQPKVWQKGNGIVFPKGSSPTDRKRITTDRAKELYPRSVHDFYGPKGGLKDGRVDALMIAHFIQRY